MTHIQADVIAQPDVFRLLAEYLRIKFIEIHRKPGTYFQAKAALVTKLVIQLWSIDALTFILDDLYCRGLACAFTGAASNTKALRVDLADIIHFAFLLYLLALKYTILRVGAQKLTGRLFSLPVNRVLS